MRVIQKIIANYWEMDIKPFFEVVLKPSDTAHNRATSERATSKRATCNHIKQWELDIARDRATSKEDVKSYSKEHKHWEDWEMSEMPYVNRWGDDDWAQPTASQG